MAIASRWLVLLCAVPSLLAQGTEALTFDDTRKPIRWQSTLPTARWAADDQHLLVRSDGKDRWLEVPSGAEAAAVAEAATSASPRRGVEGLPADDAQLGKQQEVHFSPCGNFASFVRGNDLFAVNLANKETWRITTDGGSERFHGMLDWVYQEEIYGRGNFQGHFWAPQGGMVAFLTLDESAVKEFTLVDHVPKDFLVSERGVVTEVSNYPKAGDPNPFASLSIAHAASQRVVPVDLSMFPKDCLVMRVEWTPDGKTLLATIQDRIQTWAELCAIDPASGQVTRWLREESPTWVNRPESPHWLQDGSFLWLSERTGYQHVYHYEAGGKLRRAITAGEWQVRSIERVDAASGQLWFEGTKDGATGRHLYRIGLDGTGLCCLTPGVGSHQFTLRADGAYLLDQWSAMDRPPTLRVLSGKDGSTVLELGTADRGAFAKYAASERQRVTIAARDGYPMDACVMLPVGWTKDSKVPVFLPTYSGPDAPTVRDSWQHATYHQFLAQQGFLVLQVNVRSASNRGQVHTGAAYRQLGVQELKDLEDAVDHVVAKFGGDPERVAISGWSFGGFISAYAMTNSKKFALGLAGAGVYDWRLYDTIYTERYMRTPQDNAAGYQATSVIENAKNLHGHLVLLHGSMDDNVHLQNTMQLLWELQKAGKQNFELMVYPRSRHGLNREVGAHSLEFQWLRLRRLLTVAK